jgi:hypothetical protein
MPGHPPAHFGMLSAGKELIKSRRNVADIHDGSIDDGLSCLRLVLHRGGITMPILQHFIIMHYQLAFPSRAKVTLLRNRSLLEIVHNESFLTFEDGSKKVESHCSAL